MIKPTPEQAEALAAIRKLESTPMHSVFINAFYEMGLFATEGEITDVADRLTKWFLHAGYDVVKKGKTDDAR